MAPENKSMTIEGVRSVEDRYWEMDRIIDQKMDKLMFSVGDSDDESDIDVKIIKV